MPCADLSRRRLAGLVAALATGLRRGAARAAPATEPLRVAQVIELSGALSVQGDAWRNGVELAVQEINAAGGVLGRLLQVVTYDSQSTAAGARAATVRALEVDPIALLGPTATEPARGALAVPRGSRPALLAGGGAELTGSLHPCVFRVLPSDATMATRLARWLRDGARARRLAVLAAAQPPFRDAGEALGRAARAMGLELTAATVMTNEALAELPRLLRAAPDALAVLCNAEPAGRIAQEARRLAGPGLMLCGGAQLAEPAAIEAAGAAAEELHAHVLLAPDAALPSLTAFRERFSARFKEPPAEASLGGYVALTALRLALEPPAADPRALCEALRRLKPDEAQRRALLGEPGWDATGESGRPSWIVAIRSGQPVVVRAFAA